MFSKTIIAHMFAFVKCFLQKKIVPISNRDEICLNVFAIILIQRSSFARSAFR